MHEVFQKQEHPLLKTTLIIEYHLLIDHSKSKRVLLLGLDTKNSIYYLVKILTLTYEKEHLTLNVFALKKSDSIMCSELHHITVFCNTLRFFK